MEDSLSLHARRHLIGKVFRYLKRVTVTPSLYWPFTPLKEGFSNQQWEGLTDCTGLYRIAVSYVFVKQSVLPCHFDPISARDRASLIPKLRD